MKGSLTQRGEDRWLLRAYTGQRDAKGNPVMRSRTFRGNRRKAETELARFVTEVTSDRLADAGVGATVDRLLDRWVEHIERERTAYTMKSYRQKIEGRIRPAFGNVKVEKLRPEQMDRQYAEWLEEGLSPATVRQLHAILAAALQQAYRWGWRADNPARRVRPPSVRRAPVEVPSPEEVVALIRAAEELEDWVLATAITLAALTGCRRGELCALRWSDVDLNAGVVTVAESLTAIGRQALTGDTKTHQVRRLALGDVGVEAVKARMAAQRAFAGEAEVALDPDPYLLSRSARGDLPCLPDGLTHAFGRVARSLGMSYHFHQLRHWAATMGISEGHDVVTVAGRLGHADASTTMRIYGHVLKARDEDLAGGLGRVLSLGVALGGAELVIPAESKE